MVPHKKKKVLKRVSEPIFIGFCVWILDRTKKGCAILLFLENSCKYTTRFELRNWEITCYLHIMFSRINLIVAEF